MKLIGDFARGLRSGFKRRRAKSLYEKGELDLAIALYADAISMNPDCAESHFGSGLAHLRKGKIDQAIADFTNAIRLNPGDDVAYYNRGFALLAKERFDDAIADFEAALRIDPHNPYTKEELKYARQAAWLGNR